MPWHWINIRRLTGTTGHQIKYLNQLISWEKRPGKNNQIHTNDVPKIIWWQCGSHCGGEKKAYSVLSMEMRKLMASQTKVCVPVCVRLCVYMCVCVKVCVWGNWIGVGGANQGTLANIFSIQISHNGGYFIICLYPPPPPTHPPTHKPPPHPNQPLSPPIHPMLFKKSTWRLQSKRVSCSIWGSICPHRGASVSINFTHSCQHAPIR